MRYLHIILIGVAIPLILTATIFAVPSNIGGGITVTRSIDNSRTTQQDVVVEVNNLPVAEAASGNIHHIVMRAEELESGLLAYEMVSHRIVAGGNKPLDITSKYPGSPTIPGPTIVINEGDQVFLTIKNGLGTGMVSVHVHGVHYNIISDGTLEHVNDIKDEGATTKKDYRYHWVAGPGTAGTWPYHDHTFGGINGAENRGLFGTVIVNPASGTVLANDGGTVLNVSLSDVSKNIVLYLGDDAFWGTEIRRDGTQVALWTNPHLRAEDGQLVRFHLIALGTDLHEFGMEDYQIVDPVTSDLVDTKPIGPLENLQFTIRAEQGSGDYLDLQTSNALMGVEGTLEVVGIGGPGNSIPSDEPEEF